MLALLWSLIRQRSKVYTNLTQIELSTVEELGKSGQARLSYYIGVSNLFNPGYNSVTGAGDTAGAQNVTGDYRFPVAGTYFVGVSNWLNRGYSAITGDGDAWSWQHAIGSYKLILKNSAGSMMLFAGGGAPNSSSASGSAESSDAWFARLGRQQPVRTEQVSSLSDFARIDLG